VIRESLTSALRAALSDVGIDAPPDIHLERPARREHGDWSSNVAMATAKKNGRIPRELAAELVERLNASPPQHVERAEIAGPGFVNFHLRPTWLHDVLATVVTEGEDGYARLAVGQGETDNVEFV
jgi:arginyl-tRNA synthetase